MTSGEARIIRSTVNTLLFMPSLPYVCRYPSAAAIREIETRRGGTRS